MIGRGGLDFCSGVSAGMVECTNHHISHERGKSKLELVPAFWEWRLSEMGKMKVLGIGFFKRGENLKSPLQKPVLYLSVEAF